MSPSRLCECGCGTRIVAQDERGRQRRFVKGHHPPCQPDCTCGRHAKRERPWIHRPKSSEHRRRLSESNTAVRSGDENQPSTVHAWLNRTYPRSGVCEWCGRVGKTEYANLREHEYTRNREEYAELCRSCHKTFDVTGRRADQ